LNHLIAEELPCKTTDGMVSNSDPVTGQAGWYDVRVKVYKAEDDEPEVTSPRFKTLPMYPGMMSRNKRPNGYKSGTGFFQRLLKMAGK